MRIFPRIFRFRHKYYLARVCRDRILFTFGMATINPSSLISFNKDVLEADRKVLETKFNEETSRWISWMVHPYAISFAIVVSPFGLK